MLIQYVMVKKRSFAQIIIWRHQVLCFYDLWTHSRFIMTWHPTHQGALDRMDSKSISSSMLRTNLFSHHQQTVFPETTRGDNICSSSVMTPDRNLTEIFPTIRS